MAKILLMSHCVPPIIRGPSVIISRLFKRFSSQSYVVLTSEYQRKNLPLSQELTLPANYYYVNIDTIVGGCSNKFLSTVKRWLEVIPIVIKGCKVIFKESCDRILVSPTHGNILLASYIIHKICRKKLFVYLFDLFDQDESKYNFEKYLKRISEKLSLNAAEAVFVMSEKLKEHYQARYPNLKIYIIRHPTESNIGTNINKWSQMDIRKMPSRIVFTGMIYEYQADAIRNISKAVSEMEGVLFDIYTPREKKYLEREGILLKNVNYCGSRHASELIDIQKNADILFLPMSFHGPGTNPEVIRTASPSKIGEYLGAGVPILVHAPEDSYIVWYAKKYDFAVVVDKEDINLVKINIMKLVEDKELREKIVLNAYEVAKMHNIEKVSKDLFSGLHFGS